MKSRNIFFALLFITIILIFIYSCKDMGTEPPATGLSASSTNVIVNKRDSAKITLSGGILPYSIKRQPNTAKATISLVSSVLTISGVDTGSTNTVVADSKTPVPDSLEIMISILGTSIPVSFSNQIQPIFNTQCVGGCHGSGGGLSLAAGTSYNHLVNVQAQSNCRTLKRVLPNNATNSVLYLKVSGTTCGFRMPEGGALNASDIALIQDWINQGANNN
jgi:hypothetical protein